MQQTSPPRGRAAMFHFFHRRNRSNEVINAVRHLETKIMAQFDDLKDAIADEDSKIDAVLALVAAEVAQITDLTQKLADALANVAPDMAPLIADVQAHTAALAAVLPAPAP